MAEEPHVIQHLGQEERDVRSPAEAEDVDLVARVVEPHQEAITADDVLVEGGAHGAVFGLYVP